MMEPIGKSQALTHSLRSIRLLVIETMQRPKMILIQLPLVVIKMCIMKIHVSN